MKFPNIPQQILRLIILFAIALAALISARIIFVPSSFGKYGHYRANAVDEIQALPISYAGYNACTECHDDISDVKMMSNHRDVSCEACHGPAVQHIETPDEILPQVPRKRGFCTLCHGYDPSRPTGFPQIILYQHNPGKQCMTCHDPHSPVLPHKPQECSACHREIAYEKRVSHHASLPCTECHVAPEEHWSNPRLVAVEKPISGELCGKCHDRNADSPKEIPRVDLKSHSGHYLCWDCHYPHHPEAR